jgi:two-component system sensor kinase FixL
VGKAGEKVEYEAVEQGMAPPSRDVEAVSRWKAIVESAVDGIVVIDASGRIEAFNPAAERLFGYREAELLGQNVSLLMPSPHREQHDAYLRNYLTTGTAKIIGKGREVVAQRRDGSAFPIHLSVGEVILEGERKFTGIIHDLSERVAMEQRLREQTALARLGEMAAVVAHEVKNPLAAIRAAVQTLGAQLPAESRHRDIAQQVVGRIDALSDLMHELLLFARPPRPRGTLVDLEVLLASTAEFVKTDPALAAIDISIQGDAPPVTADPELLKIVFLNLMVNSAQAMGGRGLIRVDLETSPQTCAISIHDSGPGVPVEVREMVFMPFFTTKRKGTGLGLATAKRLVEAHGGTIALVCPHEGGTRVTVHLPITRPGDQLKTSSTTAYTR